MLKYFIATIALFILLFSPVFSQSDWYTLKNEEYNFTVDLPLEPIFEIDSVDTFGFNIITRIWQAEIEEEDSYLLCQFSHVSYPKEFLQLIGSETSSDELLNTFLTAFDEEKLYKKISNKTITKNGYQGIKSEWSIAGSDIHAVAETYLVDDAMMQILIFNDQDSTSLAIKDRYFNSFSFINIPDGTYKIPEPAPKTYKVDFPKEPEKKTEILLVEGVTVPFTMYSHQPKFRKNDLFLSSEITYPDIVELPQDEEGLDMFFENAANATALKMKGEVESLTNINSGNTTGKEVRITMMEGQYIAVYRYFLKDRTFYNIGVITKTRYDNNNSMVKFLDSFEILENEPLQK